MEAYDLNSTQGAAIIMVSTRARRISEIRELYDDGMYCRWSEPV